jgi:hypothetical protein
LLSNDSPVCDFLNPIDNAWMLLKEVTLEDLRQAARTGGLPDTPERQAASDGHPGIPAALSGVEPFYRCNMPSGKIRQGTAGQAMAEKIMASQHGRLNEFGQPHEEGYDSTAFRDLPESMTGMLLDAGDGFPAQRNEDSYGTVEIDDARHGNEPEFSGFDDSMPEPMTVQPPEVRPPEGAITAPRQGPMTRLGQELSMTEPDPDAGERQLEAQANRAKTLASQSAQQSTASPMDAAMQALGNRKTEQSARVPAPVQRRALNTRRGGRGRGPNSQRNRGR